MTLAYELIKDHYYVRLSSYSTSQLHFQFVDDDGFKFLQAINESRIFEITYDEFLIRSIK